MKLPMEMTVGQIAAVLGGRVQGASDVKLSSVSPSPLSATASDLALIFDKALFKKIDQCNAGAIVVPSDADLKSDKPLILVDRPNLAIQRMLTAANVKRFLPPKGIHPSAVIDPTAKIGADASIGPFVAIGPGTKIGDRAVIMANVTIGGEVVIGDDLLMYPSGVISDYCQIGNRVILQQGVSIGADGYGYVTERKSNAEKKASGEKDFSDDPNPLLKVPQIGNVVIEDDVEVGANSTIDRATMGSTVIGQGTKIDNLVMIAHNCRIGRECLIIGQAVIAGSCKVGDRVIIAGNAGVKDHIDIGKDAIVEGMAGVLKDIPEHDVQSGIPSQTVRDFFVQHAHLRKLPKMSSEMREMQKRLAALEKQLEAVSSAALIAAKTGK
ncbi:MAG: UDP-3-O-(3-hydroxymyristoyl)glucosamine N-acyltransferase [Candidatus Obscuribacterales bacterium]|nr:UDP-3-O-(3-hydroxymyristoyl)glucosamine N-acyltransferase [Candidatus Obscuribacterales bacterium]